MDALWLETRFALRALRRRPGFTLVAALTLALGIGANAAIFAVVRGVLLQPLPYDDPGGLVTIGVAPDRAGDAPGSMSLPDLQDLEREAGSLATVVGYSPRAMTLTEMGEPVVVSIGRVSKGLLASFRLAPILGRDILEGESGRDAPPFIVLGHGFWQEQFGGSGDVLGRTVRLNGISYQVIGVAPAGFDFPAGVQGWIPRRMDPEGCGRGCHTWRVIARLAVGGSVSAASLEAEAIGASLAEAYPESNYDKAFLVHSLRDDVVGDVRTGLWILFGAVAAVLIIACANVANLLLARASTRRDEMAVRAAVGASPGRIATGLLVESAALATLGAVGGLSLAWGGVAALRRLSAGTLPRVEMISVDGTVVLFALVLAGLVTFAFGLSPALQVARASLSANLRTAGRGGTARGRRALRSALTVSEMALSVLLLIGAGLLLRTFAQMYAIDMGFESREITRFTVSLPTAEYTDLDQVRTFYRTLEGRIGALPGVEAVGSAYGSALAPGWTSGDVHVAGRPVPRPEEEVGATIRAVSPGFLETLRIPLVRGRLLEPADDASGPPVALVNEAFVRAVFPDEEAIGRQVRITVDMGYGSPDWRIVGVLADTRARSLTREADPQIFVPHGRFGPTTMTVHIRGVPGATAGIGPVREEVRALDPNLPLRGVETVEEAIQRQIAPTRFFLLGVGMFAGLAVVLAIVGLYGVMAYLVARRMRELGIRVALGAQPGAILRMVLRDGARPAVLGAAIGVALALAGGRLLEGLLYGVTARDPWILLGVPVVLTLVAVAAVLPLAARASRVDPVEILRSE